MHVRSSQDSEGHRRGQLKSYRTQGTGSLGMFEEMVLACNLPNSLPSTNQAFSDSALLKVGGVFEWAMYREQGGGVGGWGGDV